MTKMDEHFGDARVEYARLMTTAEGAAHLEGVLQAGAVRARAVARATLARCYTAVGMDNAARRLV